MTNDLIDPKLRKRSDEIRQAFQSEDPLPQFVVIANFLRRKIVMEVLEACQRAEYGTVCTYSTSGNEDDFHTQFSEPVEDGLYFTIHEQPTHLIPELERVAEQFGDPATISALSDLSGVPLEKLERRSLTCWGPGAFIEPHTDHPDGNRVKLLVNLSLTKEWDPSFGGMANYSWPDIGRTVRLLPRLNTAVLFRPFDGSRHWVEQVSEDAPPRRRFTWTIGFA